MQGTSASVSRQLGAAVHELRSLNLSALPPSPERLGNSINFASTSSTIEHRANLGNSTAIALGYGSCAADAQQHPVLSATHLTSAAALHSELEAASCTDGVAGRSATPVGVVSALERLDLQSAFRWLAQSGAEGTSGVVYGLLQTYLPGS